MEALFFAAVGLPFVLFALLCRARRARFRALADALHGAHVDAGPFVPGGIHGTDFEIEAAKSGKAYRTELRVAAGRTPGTFVLQTEFFEGFPDWRCARVPGVRRERLFFWQVSLPGYVEPDEAQRAQLLRWLAPPPHADTLEALRSAKVREVRIDDGFVSASFSGIVTNLERLRRTLDALRSLAPGERRSAGHARRMASAKRG